MNYYAKIAPFLSSGRNGGLHAFGYEGRNHQYGARL